MSRICSRPGPACRDRFQNKYAGAFGLVILQNKVKNIKTTFTRTLSRMTTAVCTLFEKDYHLGTGALVNSLFDNGFRGIFWAGYRGDLPPWAHPIRSNGAYAEFKVAEDCYIRFVLLDTPRHFAYYKPDFMQYLWQHYCADADALCYFDPDITIKCPWSFFEAWVQHGLAVCEDINNYMPDDHPVRQAWKEYAQDHGLACHRPLQRYFNSGFVGVRKGDLNVLELWRGLIDMVGSEGSDLSHFQRQDFAFPYIRNDQDAFNLALMLSTNPLSTVGPEGMDFVPGGQIMSHAAGAGAKKPWKKAMARAALGGVAPTLADKRYWQYAESPIRLYSPPYVRWKKLDIKVGAAIGRFITRK